MQLVVGKRDSEVAGGNSGFRYFAIEDIEEGRGGRGEDSRRGS
jgi:hypothetical protein